MWAAEGEKAAIVVAVVLVKAEVGSRARCSNGSRDGGKQEAGTSFGDGRPVVGKVSNARVSRSGGAAAVAVRLEKKVSLVDGEVTIGVRAVGR